MFIVSSSKNKQNKRIDAKFTTIEQAIKFRNLLMYHLGPYTPQIKFWEVTAEECDEYYVFSCKFRQKLSTFITEPAKLNKEDREELEQLQHRYVNDSNVNMDIYYVSRLTNLPGKDKNLYAVSGTTLTLTEAHFAIRILNKLNPHQIYTLVPVKTSTYSLVIPKQQQDYMESKVIRFVSHVSDGTFSLYGEAYLGEDAKTFDCNLMETLTKIRKAIEDHLETVKESILDKQSQITALKDSIYTMTVDKNRMQAVLKPLNDILNNL